MKMEIEKKKWLKLLLAVFFGILLLVGIVLAVSVGSGKKVVFTTGFGQDEVFRIGSVSCTKPEVMVYLTNVQNRYEEVYGEEVWTISKDGVTLEDNVRETVLARLAQVKTMYLLALEKEVSLEESEQALVRRAAEEYYQSLSERETELLGVKQDTIQTLYEEYALANKVYEYIIRDVNPEISDDEARTITVQHIFLKTYSTDAEGNRQEFDASKKEEIYKKACEIREEAAAGTDFAELAARYSEDSTVTYSFGKGEMEQNFEEAAFNLETGEISQVVETEAGYHIIRCVNTFDREQTDLNKQTIVEQRRKEVFGQEYDTFAEGLVRQLNTKLWEEIHLLHDEALITSDFFEVYHSYFEGL